jgi:hypothetical protein
LFVVRKYWTAKKLHLRPIWQIGGFAETQYRIGVDVYICPVYCAKNWTNYSGQVGGHIGGQVVQ